MNKNENIKVLIKKLSEAPELTAKFAVIRDPEEAYSFASNIQSGFTKEEFIEAMTSIYEAISIFNELTDEDIAKVAGGGTTTGVAVAAVSFGTAAAAV